jgi:hypothetical protein
MHAYTHTHTQGYNDEAGRAVVPYTNFVHTLYTHTYIHTHTQGYNDEAGRAVVPYVDTNKCRRFANGIIATPANHTALKTMYERSRERTIQYGLTHQEKKGQNGTHKDGFHIGLTGPFLWKTVIRPDKSFSILSMKTFLPCGFRNPVKQKHCEVKNYVGDPGVYGMHRLTMT